MFRGQQETAENRLQGDQNAVTKTLRPKPCDQNAAYVGHDSAGDSGRRGVWLLRAELCC